MEGVEEDRDEATGTFIQPRGDVKGAARDAYVGPRPEHPVLEDQAKPAYQRRHDLHVDELVVADGCRVSDVGLKDGQDQPILLQPEQRRTHVAQELASGLLEQVQEPRVVNMVAEGALGIHDAVRMTEGLRLGSRGPGSDGSAHGCACVSRKWGMA